MTYYKVNDDIALQFSWFFLWYSHELGSNIQTSLDCYVFTRMNGILTFDIS